MKCVLKGGAQGPLGQGGVTGSCLPCRWRRLLHGSTSPRTTFRDTQSLVQQRPPTLTLGWKGQKGQKASIKSTCSSDTFEIVPRAGEVNSTSQMHQNDMHSFRATGSSVKGLGSGVFFPTETLGLAVLLQTGQEIMVAANNPAPFLIHYSRPKLAFSKLKSTITLKFGR